LSYVGHGIINTIELMINAVLFTFVKYLHVMQEALGNRCSHRVRVEAAAKNSFFPPIHSSYISSMFHVCVNRRSQRL